MELPWQEVPYELTYLGVSIRRYCADVVVESLVIVETKTGLLLDPIGVPQALKYLSASRLPVTLVAHFGPRVTVKRVALTGQGHSVFDQPAPATDPEATLSLNCRTQMDAV